MVPKETVKKFQTSIIKVDIDKPSLKKNILKTKVTLVNKVTHKVVHIKNLKITQLLNDSPIGKGPTLEKPVYPGDRQTVKLKVIVEVPNLGSRTKEILMPVKNGSEY